MGTPAGPRTAALEAGAGPARVPVARYWAELMNRPSEALEARDQFWEVFSGLPGIGLGHGLEVFLEPRAEMPDLVAVLVFVAARVMAARDGTAVSGIPRQGSRVAVAKVGGVRGQGSGLRGSTSRTRPVPITSPIRSSATHLSQRDEPCQVQAVSIRRSENRRTRKLAALR